MRASPVSKRGKVRLVEDQFSTLHASNNTPEDIRIYLWFSSVELRWQTVANRLVVHATRSRRGNFELVELTRRDLVAAAQISSATKPRLGVGDDQISSKSTRSRRRVDQNLVDELGWATSTNAFVDLDQPFFTNILWSSRLYPDLFTCLERAWTDVSVMPRLGGYNRAGPTPRRFWGWSTPKLVAERPKSRFS